MTSVPVVALVEAGETVTIVPAGMAFGAELDHISVPSPLRMRSLVQPLSVK